MTDHDLAMATSIWSNNRTLDDVTELHGQQADDELDAKDEVLARAVTEWAWLWAEDGFWSLVCGHKFGAALMATESAGFGGDLILPGRAIRIAVPEGLLRSRGYDYRWLYVGAREGGAFLLISECRALDTSDAMLCSRRFMLLGQSASDVLLETADELPEDVPNVKVKARIARLARRLAVGLLYTMQHTTNFRTREFATYDGRPASSPRRPPNHRVAFVGGPIVVDARPQIARWLDNKVQRSPAAPPSLQHIVRGHYKRQVIGEGRGGRKVIWVQPYWRGPEDAPILVHPYSVGGAA